MKRVEKTSSAVSSDLMSNKDTSHIQEPWLTLARLAWIVIVVPTFALFVSNIPSYFAALHRLHLRGQHVFTGQLTLVDIHTLESWGLSLDFYATCMVLVSLLFQFSYAAVGVILFWKRSNDRVALFASFALLMFPFGFGYLTFFFNLIFFGLIASTIIVQIYRYRTVSTPRQRQQTMWVVYGISIAAMGNLGTRLLFTYVIIPLSHYTLLLAALEVLLITCSMLVIPPTLGIAILRSRLWDIDVIINRTLVYAVLTAILALVYFVSIIFLQSLVNVLTGQFSLWSQSPLVIVASTLGIAALFQPLRRRIQAVIDRRFYRSKYDAARTLSAFSATLRDEVDLDELKKAMLTVVQETMQPSHVSLWLKTTEKDRN
jgi:hypothetical protein